ncbi:MAG: polyphosphate kinase 2 [Bacteroidota bacterium]
MVQKKFTAKEIKYLNSNKAIKAMLEAGDKVQPEKVLRYVNYEKRLESYQVELIKLQNWVIENNRRVCVLFEGRDAAGKGGAIRRITHHLNPRHYTVIALPKPTTLEKGQWYFQRYVNRLPSEGEIVFFDRSWYNRAVVEPVNGFCTEFQYQRFMGDVNNFEEMITGGSLILIKLYFSITKAEQKRRFNDIKSDPLKRWKMSPVDEKAQELWDKYTKYKEEMFRVTDTKKNPWTVIKADRKSDARLEAVQHLLDKVPYKEDSKPEV